MVTLPVNGHANVLAIPQDERDPLVIVGQTDVAGKVHARFDERHDICHVLLVTVVAVGVIVAVPAGFLLSAAHSWKDKESERMSPGPCERA